MRFNSTSALAAASSVSGVVNLLHSYTAPPLVTESLLLASEGIGGVGKSIAMLQTVVEARRSGWLVLYIPDGEC